MTYLLARTFKSLQQVPIDLPGLTPVYIDMRMGNSHTLLMNAPYPGLWRELDEVTVMRRFVRDGDVVFDIGGNIGLHSILLSHLIGPRGRLHTFEPNTELLPSLARTIAHLPNATLHAVALSDTDTQSRLFVPVDDSMASLKDWTVATDYREGGEARVVTCQQQRMDDLVSQGILPKPDFIKCDVEGAELLVFKGGQQTLDRPDAPIILFEINKEALDGFGFEVSAAKDFLARLGSPRYQFLTVQQGGDLARVREMAPFMNLLAVPQAKMQRWPELVTLLAAGK
jgi:FkbM family methyltransferase